MSQSELKDPVQIRSIISSKFIEPGFEYWFTNHEHVRSPFPSAIRNALKERTSIIFFEWIDGMKETELKAMKEDEFAEMFETILFNEAIKLVEDEDQQLTISYPFLPRLGDQVNHSLHGKGNICSRKEVVSKENKKLFELSVLSQETGQTWATQFEL
ncbi:MAG: hypothetical protein Q8T04_07110 [Bacteroidota bacterium]|nr:hypothetical protein [Bacteroidota bacterium]